MTLEIVIIPSPIVVLEVTEFVVLIFVPVGLLLGFSVKIILFVVVFFLDVRWILRSLFEIIVVETSLPFLRHIASFSERPSAAPSKQTRILTVEKIIRGVNTYPIDHKSKACYDLPILTLEDPEEQCVET